MQKKTKQLILLVAIIQLLLIAFFMAPKLIRALPPTAHAMLPSAVKRLASTPISNLPAPAANTDAPATVIATLPDGAPAIPGLDATETPAPTATTEPTPQPTAEEALQPVEATATNIPEPTATPAPTATPTPKPIPKLARVDGLVNVPQTFNNCGPANLSMVLEHLGDPTTQTQAASYLKPNAQDRNVSPWQISDYVNDFTALRSTVHSAGTLDMLKQLIAAGYTPVIERGADFEDGEGWYGHYLTLFSYDDDQSLFMAMDTYSIPWAPSGTPFSYETVEKSWRAFNYTFYVAYEAADEPEVFDIIGETLLDEDKMWTRAIEMANADIAKDPEDVFAWFNLGTSWTERGALDGNQLYYQNGTAAYDEARRIGLPGRMLWYQFRPYLAYFKVGRSQDVIDLAEATIEGSKVGGKFVEETFYWQGNALASLGDVAGALKAYEQALSVNENFYYAQWAIDSING